MKRSSLLCAALLVVTALGATSCAAFTKDVKTVGTDAKDIAVDCTKQTIQDAIPNVLPQVNSILISGTTTEAAKDAALDQLSLSGAELLACAVREAFEDLSKLKDVLGSAQADVGAASGVAQRYMSAKGYQFSDGFKPSP